MNELAYQKFQKWLQSEGVSAEDADYLANLWGEISDALGRSVGLGASQEGDTTWVFLHVPGVDDGIRISLAEVEAMDDPPGELAKMIRTRLLKQ